MVCYNESVCPSCGGELSYYDNVLRRVKVKKGVKKEFKMRRFRCSKCNKIHRELTNNIIPYKQYDREIIKGVLNGFITPSTIGFEDYPTELTMKRWIDKFSTYFDVK